MPINTTYGAGGTTTQADIPQSPAMAASGDMDFYRRMAMRSTPKGRPAKSTVPAARRPTENVVRPSQMSSVAPGGTGSHGFVTNMFGANQVGGYMEAGEGPRSVYGGWRVNPSPGPTRFASLPSEWSPALPGPSAEDQHAAINAASLNLGPSLAQSQARTRALLGR